MIDKKTQQKLHDWARAARQIQLKLILNTRALTPVNYHKEMERFLSSKRYNPRFEYKTPYISNIKRKIHDLAKRLSHLDLPPELTAYLESYIHHLLLAARTRNAVGTDRFGSLAKSMYNYEKIDTDKLLSLLPPLTFANTKGARVLTAKAMQDLFQNYITNHPHIQDAAITIDEFNDHTIRVGHKRLTIGAAVRRNMRNVERLIVHEIESHMLQRQNLIQLGNPLLELRKIHERELFAEGMAVYNEEKSGTMTEKTFEMYIIRHRAVTMIDKSFREIFDYLSTFVPTHKAFVTTYRVKRGMHRTEKPGGFPKDASYLLGFHEVTDYVLRGGKLDMLYLSPVPDLGQLLLKYDLLPTTGFVTPRFWQE